MNPLDLTIFVVLMVLVFTLVIGVILLLVLLVRGIWQELSWKRSGRYEIIEAQISHKDIDDSEGSTSYFIKYAFSVEGKFYESTCSIPQHKYFVVNIGTSIPIMYNKENPSQSDVYFPLFF